MAGANDAQGNSFVQGLVSLPPEPEEKKKKEGRIRQHKRTN
jgi:hypothetical protein